jgi:hypothetical protein
MVATAVKIVGIEQVNANLLTLKGVLPEQLGYAMREELMAVADDSIPQCPVDDANMHEDGSPHLVDTIQVTGPEFEGDNVSVSISYGNENDPTGDYAIVQHESMEFQHTRPGTKAKYLEDPLNARAKYIPTNLIRAVSLESKGIGYTAQSLQSLQTATLTRSVKQRYGNQVGRFL